MSCPSPCREDPIEVCTSLPEVVQNPSNDTEKFDNELREFTEQLMKAIVRRMELFSKRERAKRPGHEVMPTKLVTWTNWAKPKLNNCIDINGRANPNLDALSPPVGGLSDPGKATGRAIRNMTSELMSFDLDDWHGDTPDE